MKNFLIIIYLLALTTSCAGSSKWKITDVSPAKREWRICSEHLDGPEKHHKGFCYISQECKSKKKCRPLPLFCEWGDIPCMGKYLLLQKRLR